MWNKKNITKFPRLSNLPPKESEWPMNWTETMQRPPHCGFHVIFISINYFTNLFLLFSFPYIFIQFVSGCCLPFIFFYVLFLSFISIFRPFSSYFYSCSLMRGCSSLFLYSISLRFLFSYSWRLLSPVFLGRGVSVRRPSPSRRSPVAPPGRAGGPGGAGGVPLSKQRRAPHRHAGLLMTASTHPWDQTLFKLPVFFFS